MLTKNLTSRNLLSLISYEEDGIISKPLVKKGIVSATLFSFSKGEMMEPHSSPKEATIVGLEGKAEITVNDKVDTISALEMIEIPEGETHSIFALANFKMVLIIKEK